MSISARSFQYFTACFILCLANVVNAQVRIVAHRGGLYDQFPESSLSLFDATTRSFKADTVVVEIDIRESKDGTLYLMHDPTVDRTSSGKGKLEDLSDKELNTLRLRKKDGNITAEHIPTFDEVLTFIRNRNINLMLDIKAPIHEKVLEQVKKHKLEHRMLVLTFQNDITAQVAKKGQNFLLSALIETDEAWKSFEQIPMQPGKRVAYITVKTTSTLIDTLRQKNVLIMADVSEDQRNGGKPLNAAEYRTKVSRQKLDILISDFPIEARNAVISER